MTTIQKTKFYFFSGKGGVGKTTMAASSAMYYANSGKRTLIITTDPASNLADVFEQSIGHQVTPIAGLANLFALELDPDKATEEYRERTLAPLRGLIPGESFAVLEEQLNSPCTAEIAAFERFTDFLQGFRLWSSYFWYCSYWSYPAFAGTTGWMERGNWKSG